MKQIHELFDSSKDIHRSIEKVITYNVSQEARLKSEVSEYIATESIEDAFERLLGLMQTAMDSGDQNEIGVWVSGFYGSGKSSFTKYLGLALDDSARIDGVPFLKHLQDRFQKAQTRALLGTLAAKYPAAVVLLDLASEMVAGATMEDVSTVLYYKVLQWAGYSRNLKVAAFERRLQKDGRYDEFTARIQSDLGMAWKEVQNDPLVVDSLLPEIAHAMYPALFKTATAFSTETTDFVRFETERVKEMLDIVREKSGRQQIVFIVDEVGQYVGSRPNLILNLDGLAKNLKAIGDGKVWIIGTAQQTLTEDDPRAALNSPELFKLSARFPIQIDLESSDIKEICYRRLLAKSPAGEAELGTWFDKFGQPLRHHTKLQDAKYYEADFDRQSFINLYPFLPAHFDILLHLLGALAKTTGGIGLRSAIKVIQDILVEGPDNRTPVAKQPVGWLATTVTLYDALEKDVRRAFPSVHKAVGKAILRFHDCPFEQDVAKTVAILQILNNMPVTRQNIAALMQDRIDAESCRDRVDKAVQALMGDPIVPFGEKDGSLCFFSETLNGIEQERANIPLRSAEARRIHNEALREAFSPLPSVRLHGTLAVTTGLKAGSGSSIASLAGERETVQTVVEFVDPKDYETARARLVEESRQKSSQSTVYLVGRMSKDIEDRVLDIWRSREIANRHRSDPETEVREYCAAQSDRAVKLAVELQHTLKQALLQGSLIFRADATAVESLNHELLTACKKHLETVAGQVFDRFGEAPVRADTTLAEKFLRQGNLKGITTQLDPLGFVKLNGGTPQIHTSDKALVSLKDYLDRNGAVEGKRLADHFTDAPFGWSPDTLRYMVAALLVAGEIKLKVSGREVTVNGQVAVDALKTNNSFKSVGVSLRDVRPSMEVLARAAQRLTDLVGDTVIPLEAEISKVAAKQFPTLQHRFAPLAERLAGLGLPGAETIRSVSQQLADILLADASEAPQQLGGEESALYDGLKWAALADQSLKNGLESTIRDLQQHRAEIEAFPQSGIPGELRDDLAEELTLLTDRLGQQDFFKHAVDFSTTLTSIKTSLRDSATQMGLAQQNTIRDAQKELQRLPEWLELTQSEQTDALGKMAELVLPASQDLAGFKQLLRQEYVIANRLSVLRKQIEQLGRDRQRARLKEEQEKCGQTKLTRKLSIPRTLTATSQVETLIQQLQTLKSELAQYHDIEVTIQIEG